MIGSANDARIDQPQLGIHLGPEQIQQTPLLSRRITYLPLLNAANRPAINQGDIFMNENLFTTNGAGRRQSYFEVDGANSIDSWGRQTIFTNVRRWRGRDDGADQQLFRAVRRQHRQPGQRGDGDRRRPVPRAVA